MVAFGAYAIFALVCAVVFYLYTRRDDHHNVGLMMAIYGWIIAVAIPAAYELFCFLFNSVSIVIKF
jgi:hypothetical protein